MQDSRNIADVHILFLLSLRILYNNLPIPKYKSCSKQHGYLIPGQVRIKKWLKIKDKNVTFIKQKCLFMKEMNSIMDLCDMDK